MRTLSEIIGGCKKGEIFYYEGQDWIFFTGTKTPPELHPGVEGGKWRILRMDGQAYTMPYAPCRSDAFFRNRNSSTCVIGYWYDGAKKTSTDTKTFKFKGHVWTHCTNDEMPAELAGIKAGEWQYLTHGGMRTGLIGLDPRDANHPHYWDGHRNGIIAYRILNAEKKEIPAPVADPNADMLKRDGEPETAAEKQAKLVEALVGNGCIFAPPKQEVPNLFRVAPITGTGTSLWGAERLGE